MPTDRPDDRGADPDNRPQVSALARTVISVLNEESGTTPIRRESVRRLVTAALSRDRFDPEAALLEFEREGISPELVVDRYIPEAAREIGTRWVDDSLTFAEVSVVAAQLQGMLTLLSGPWPSAATDLTELNVLMVLQRGETHTLGTHVAMAQMRRRGVSVRLLIGPDDGQVEKAIAEDDYALVMFSCSRADDLASISETAKRIRIASPGMAPAIVLGGIVLGLAEDAGARSGADLVTNDVATALQLGDLGERQKRGSMAQQR